jgi:hypothetical protein
MKRSAMVWHAAVWPALLLGSVSLAAQYPVPAQNQKSFGVASTSLFRPGSGAPSVVVPTGQPQMSGCPVSLRAQHLADGSMVRARDAHPKGVGQWLHLAVAYPEAGPSAAAAKEVTGALITVHGFADVPRMTEAAPAAEARADAKRTILVPFSTATYAGPAAGADVWVPGMTAVTSIDLKSVTYADGSQWSLTGGGSCRITPDPLMLIAGK